MGYRRILADSPVFRYKQKIRIKVLPIKPRQDFLFLSLNNS